MELSLIHILGKSGPKARSEDVADGQQVEIPVLHMVRTVGTRGVNGSRERKDRSKHRRRCAGKSAQ